MVSRIHMLPSLRSAIVITITITASSSSSSLSSNKVQHLLSIMINVAQEGDQGESPHKSSPALISSLQAPHQQAVFNCHKK